MDDRSALAARARKLLLAAINDPGSLPELSPADWDLLLRMVRRARLLGRLEADLADAGLLTAIPPRVANHLRASRNVIQHRQTLMAWEVNRLAWALKDIRAPLILLKGAAYVLAGLPPSRGRLFADVDFLVPEQWIGDVEKSCLHRGWFSVELHPYDERYYRLWMHEIPPLRHRERGTEIDIHHRLLPRTSRLRSDPAPLFASARRLNDGPFSVLQPTDMVLHALVHLFLEGDPNEGLRLRDLVDVHDLLGHFATAPDFWEGLVPRARELGFERPLYYGLRFVREFFNTPIPEGVMAAAEYGTPTRLQRYLMDRLIPLTLLPEHPEHPRRCAALARNMIYLRAHWLRMPAGLLARHLALKTWLRLRGTHRQADLTRLDLRQQ